MPDEGLIRFYCGRSMIGTFRIGDCLTVNPVLLNSICKGDVVVFRGLNERGEEKELVHRVMAVYSDHLITRGDNSPSVDTKVVTAENLVGLTTHFERNGRRHRIRGGHLGLLRAGLFHALFPLFRLARVVGGPAYRWLRESGLVAWLWCPILKKIHLRTNKGLLIKYTYKKRTVGRSWPEKGRFKCRKPYDLVLRFSNLCDKQSKDV